MRFNADWEWGSGAECNRTVRLYFAALARGISCGVLFCAASSLLSICLSTRSLVFTAPAALVRALASLDHSLRQRGSALIVRVGPWEQQLPALAAELGAPAVVAEAEVEAGELEQFGQLQPG